MNTRCRVCEFVCEEVYWGRSGWPYCSPGHRSEARDVVPPLTYDKGLDDFRREARAQGESPRKR
jgi:hypothetical protein